MLRLVGLGTALARCSVPARTFGENGNRSFGGGGGQGRRSPPVGGRAGAAFRGGPPRPTEPQLVAKLLELFPVEKPWVPISKWAQMMPDDVREALVAYDGLGSFTASQSNFFIVRTENGVKVVSLSTLGSNLCRERIRKENQERKHAEKYQKFNQRRSSSGNRGRQQRQQRIQ